MPERLSLATVAVCAVLAAAVFGGAYALAHDGPAKPAPAPAAPAAIRLADRPIGELGRVRALPALIVPPPRPEPVEPVEVEPRVEDSTSAVVDPTPQVVTPTPTTTPTPQPRTPPPAKKPLTFDDSG